MPSKIVAGIPLSDLLDELLGSQDFVSINNTIAQAMAIADSKEESIHVQFKDVDTGKLLDRPLIWWKHKWLLDVKRREHIKAQCVYDNNRLNIFKEDVTRVAKKLHSKTGLPLADCISLGRKMMLHVVKTSDKSFFENLGVYIEDVPPQLGERLTLDFSTMKFEGEK